MKEKSPFSQKPQTMKVTLDGKLVKVPDWITASVAAIQSYLEGMAIEKERVLWSLQVDGVTVSLAKAMGGVQSFNTVKATSITFGELSRHLITAGRDKVVELKSAIEETIPLILINDWVWCQKIWREWQPQFREPLFSLRALQELKQPELLGILNSQCLSEHLDKITAISAEMDILIREQEKQIEPSDTIAFTEIVEAKVVPWMEQLGGYFDQLHDKARA